MADILVVFSGLEHKPRLGLTLKFILWAKNKFMCFILRLKMIIDAQA
jgi:hypothetical protein